MKDKIKKFYEQYEDQIMIGTSVVSVCLLTWGISRIMVDQHRVVQADVLTFNDGENAVYVHYKNGTGQTFGRPLSNPIPIPGLPPTKG
jgi:hypothetical protein